MYKEILIATDGSELANRALAHGLKLANEVKARVTIVTVTPPWSALDLAHEARLRKPDPIHQFEEMAAASAKVILDAAGQTAKTAGVAYELVHVPDQHPAEGISATAEKNGCDLIVMASHRAAPAEGEAPLDESTGFLGASCGHGRERHADFPDISGDTAEHTGAASGAVGRSDRNPNCQ